MTPKTKKLIAREIFVVVLCVLGAFYLRSITTFKPGIDQNLWTIKLSGILFIVYYVVHFIIWVFKFVIGIILAVIVIAAAVIFIANAYGGHKLVHNAIEQVYDVSASHSQGKSR